MYFSNREKELLVLLLSYEEGLSLEDLERLLKVSRRTVYREIASLGQSLETMEVTLIKNNTNKYWLVGDEKLFIELKRMVGGADKEVFDTVQRQSAIAAVLLLSNEELIIEGLANDFEVSTRTIQNDLDAITQSFSDYFLSVERLKGRGVMIVGNEKRRRQILSSLIYNGNSEYEFFNFIHQLNQDNIEKQPANFFLRLISNQAYYFAKQLTKDLSAILKKVTDNQLKRALIIFALSYDRMKNAHYITTEVKIESSERALQKITREIVETILEDQQIAALTNEINFLTRQLTAINYKEPQNIFLDNYDVELSYQVKELIQEVSREYGADFRKDNVLFYDLLTHLKAALRRSDLLTVESKNTLLDNVLKEYDKLYRIIKKKIVEIFHPHYFSKAELAYIVIHFASTLENNQSYTNISALVFCSSGVGTAKILESRIKKYLPEIAYTTVAKISDINRYNIQSFDLILSTVFLPQFTFPYKLISPLLLDEELLELKQHIKENFIQAKGTVVSLNESNKEISETISFEKAYEKMRIANDLLQRFEVMKFDGKESLAETVTELIESLPVGITTDSSKVAEAVLDRYEIAPVGIPKTTIALFHSANEWVRVPYFAIMDLDQPFTIVGMDKKEMVLHRILLMLGPVPMPENIQDLLGKISSSIIENDLNLKLYQTGTKEDIYAFLSQLFITESIK